MDHYLVTHTILQLVLALPLIYVLKNWKKNSIILKIIVVVAFIYSLTFYVDTLFYRPINYEVDLSQNLAGRDYTFEIYPVKREYVVGFQIKNYRNDCGGWPAIGTDDVQINFENVIYPKLIFDIIGNKTEDKPPEQRYIKFDCGGMGEKADFLYGSAIEFRDLFKKTKIIYKIKTPPTSEIRSIILTMKLHGYDEKGITFSILTLYHTVIVYGSILVYYFCKSLSRRIKR